MSEEEILALAEKIKKGTATEVELDNFTKEYTKIISYINNEIKNKENQ